MSRQMLTGLSYQNGYKQGGGSPIPVGAYSWGMAITPDGKRVCVANLLSNDVSMIDAATHTVVATVPVGNGPSGVGIGWPL